MDNPEPAADALSGGAAPDGFAELALRPELVQALAALGYEEPTPIQREAIPPLLAGADLLGQAATGTGKTAAFALPLLQRLPARRSSRAPLALVLAPTRELAMQVAEAVHRYGQGLGARVVPVYGGQPIGRQLRVLERGVDVVVATPGRALDHLRRGSLSLAEVEVVVLDEADEMLDMGFADDLEEILSAAPEQRQTVLFSATIPAHIDRIARRHLRDPVRVRIEREGAAPGQAPKVRQTAYVVARAHKPAALGRVLDIEAPSAALVFCRTREEVDALTETLGGRGYRAEALHGGMSQEQRDRVMGRLRSGTAELLIATDVAARGLDLDNLTHVVNYNVPSAPEAYVHRIGRVGRAGREGVALTLAEPRERRMLGAIERVLGQQIPVEQVPSVAELRTRRLELTRATVQESLGADDLEGYAAVVDALAGEHDLRDVALAAVRLVHRAGGAELDEQEIPPAADPVRPRRDEAARPWGEQPGRPVRSAPRRDEPRGRRDEPDAARPLRVGGPPEARPPRGAPAGRGSAQTARLFVGMGSTAGMRPQDLVGAVAGETRLSGRDVGAIEIHERFSLVDVPSAAAEEVIVALRSATIRGGRPTVRRDRDARR